MSLAAHAPEGQAAALSLTLWPLEPEPGPEPDWAAEISMALPPLPESLPPVTFRLPPGSGADPYERLLAGLTDQDRGATGSVWFT